MGDKKTERKRKRFAIRLHNSKGIKCTEKPGPNVIICNAGQATGLERAVILELIKCNRLDINVPEFIAENGETYSYLVFDNTSDALQFFNKFNGREHNIEHICVLYMNFVDEVPNMEIVYEQELPKDLLLLDNFITAAEEEEFLKIFDWNAETSNLKNRQVRHYGYEFRYGSNDVDLSSPLVEKIPKECDILWSRLEELGYNLGVPDQLTVNKYNPGQGIPLHVDRHSPFGASIVSVSLGAAVVMDWQRGSEGPRLPLVVRARSLLLMQGEARYAWRHGIAARTSDPPDAPGGRHRPRGPRLSLTFRWTRSGPCRCRHAALCDTPAAPSPAAPSPAAPSPAAPSPAALEELHVHQVYEQIGDHFSRTRHKPWPKVVEFMQGVPPGSVVFDLGSGNGKNILNRSDIIQVACERSAVLAGACRARAGGGVVRGDVRALPFRARSCDAALCVAVLHHLSTAERRREGVAAVHAVLRRGGRALLTVWARDQRRSAYASRGPGEGGPERRVAVAGLQLPVHENRTQFKHNDLLVPWKLRKMHENKLSDQPENTFLRYYHVFDENELDDLCREVGFEIESSFYEEGNWCVVCKKQ